MLQSPLHVLRDAGESGQTLVEFALALPLLLLIIFGMLDVGKAVSYKQDLSHLANEGARYAAVDGAPNGFSGSGQNAIRDGMKAQASTNELKNGSATIEESGLSTDPATTKSGITFCYTGTGAVGDSIKATFKVKYKWLSFVGSFFPLPDQQLSASATLRLEHAYDTTTPSNNTYTASVCP